MGQINNFYHIKHTHVFHYLLIIQSGINITRNALFDFLQFKTPQVLNAAQHNITTVYIRSLTYKRNTFDLKSTPSQIEITEQQFRMIFLLKCVTNAQSSTKSWLRKSIQIHTSFSIDNNSFNQFIQFTKTIKLCWLFCRVLCLEPLHIQKLVKLCKSSVFTETDHLIVVLLHKRNL